VSLFNVETSTFTACIITCWRAPGNPQRALDDTPATADRALLADLYKEGEGIFRKTANRPDARLRPIIANFTYETQAELIEPEDFQGRGAHA